MIVPFYVLVVRAEEEHKGHDGLRLLDRDGEGPLAFAYELVEQLGGDAESLRTGMLYRDVFGKNQ